jgi:hypothetical protein
VLGSASLNGLLISNAHKLYHGTKVLRRRTGSKSTAQGTYFPPEASW